MPPPRPAPARVRAPAHPRCDEAAGSLPPRGRRRAALPVLVAILASTACGPQPPEASGRAGTPELRGALVDTLVARVSRREAFSPFKQAHWGEDPLEAMGALRDEVVEADTEEALFYALERLSNARRDRHLGMGLVEGGLRLPLTAGLEGSEEAVRHAPVRILPDYRDTTAYFVADLSSEASHFPDGRPEPGARVLAVDGRPWAEYEAAVEPYHRASWRPNQRWRIAEGVAERSAVLPPSFRGPMLELRLLDPGGDTVDVSLPYLHPDSIPWLELAEPRYPGFRQVRSTPTWDLWVPEDARPVLVLVWYGFRETMLEDVDTLMALASREGWLDRDLVVDGTRSRGGSNGAYAVQRMVSRPFRTTFGNLRLSDASAAWVAERLASAQEAPTDSGVRETVDDGTWLREWLETSVTDSLEAGADYTDDVPFKLAHAPMDSDGILDPAPVHFSGRMVAFFVPRRGSHLDQFAAILKDNELAWIVGMTPGGYSNTWEWEEVVRFPGTDRPVASFMYNIGHTIRPDGEILEGNPAVPDEWVLFSADDYRDFYPRLLRRALDHLGHG